MFTLLTRKTTPNSNDLQKHIRNNLKQGQIETNQFRKCGIIMKKNKTADGIES